MRKKVYLCIYYKHSTMEHLEYQEGRTELESLGKFAMIDRLTSGFPISIRVPSRVSATIAPCWVLARRRL